MNVGPAGVTLIKEFEGFPHGGRPLPRHGRRLDDRLRPHRGRRPQQHGHLREAGQRTAAAAISIRSTTAGDRQPSWARLGQHQYDAPGVLRLQLRPRRGLATDPKIGRALRRGGLAARRQLPADVGRNRRAETSWGPDPPPDRRARALPRQRRARARWRGYTDNERSWIREYDKLVAAKRAGHDTPAARERRSVLRRVMEQRRKAIWRAAEAVAGGWKLANRRARYRSLRARTT